MHTRSMLLGLSAALSLVFATSAAPTNPPNVRAAITAPAIHRVIVKLRGGGTEVLATGAGEQPETAAMADAFAALAMRNQLTLRRTRSILPGLHVMEIEPQTAGESLQVSLARLRADPAVQYAEPDQRRHVLAAPNDPLYVASPGATGQWYLQNSSTTASDVDAIDAWSITTGSPGLVIADIDTGVRFDHPDLLRAAGGAGGRLLPGYTFVSDVLIANDGGLADANQSIPWDADASDPGDWITQADTQIPQFSDCTVGNSTWHGTRVVGILGAIANNSVGIAGLTWGGWILPVRALGKCGGADSDIETAMLWAAGLAVHPDDLGNPVPANPYPAQIINLSLGGTGGCPSSYLDVIQQLTSAGVTVVAAAGNEGGPVDAPGNCAGVIAVAGLRHDGTKVGFSSLGPEIALSAPAGNCVNTTGPCLFSIDTSTNLGLTTPGTNSYTNQVNYNVGTSFATPLVAGIAGLMLSVNGNLSPSQIGARLQEGTLPFPVSSDTTVPMCHVPAGASDLQASECNCTTQTCGTGMANANGAVTAALRPIAALNPPASVTGGQSVSLDASRSAAACGQSIIGYAWSVINGTANGAISGSTTNSTASVIAPLSGSFTVQVVVSDSAGKSDTAQAVVSSTSASTTAPANAGNHACLAAITPTLPITVTVAPSSASVQAGLGSQTFTAAVTSTANHNVSWQVNGINGGNPTVGTISSAGIYTPPVNPPSSPTVSVIAVSVANPKMTGFAGVTITPPVTVSVSPASVMVLAGGGSQAFTATVVNAGLNTAVTWTVNGIAGGNPTIGTISTDGLYTAPATVPAPAIVQVTAVPAADPTRPGSATVTIANVTVTLTPASARIPTGGTQAFVASVMNTSNAGVTWNVNGIVGGGPAIGTISTSGVYTAPSSVPSPATVTVSAVSVADSARSGSALVTVTAASGSSSSGSASTSGASGGGGALYWPELIALAALAAVAVAVRRRRTGPLYQPMQRRRMALLTLTLLGAACAAHGDSRWVAGVHYFLISPAQPTGLPAGKILVTEIFSYACPGCNRFYPVADRLAASLPANAVMDFLPASFRPDEDWPMFQRAYLTAKEMGIDKRTHGAMFDAVWKSGELAVFDPATQRAKRPPPSLTDAARFYAQAAGVKPEAFLATAASFAVDVKVQQADELIRNYAIGETPSIVVNGKYRLNPVSAGGYDQTIELVKWLVAQEGRPGDTKPGEKK